MTLPVEKIYAIKNTKAFIEELVFSREGAFKRIPKDVRIQALQLLKHYPHKYELDKLQELLKDNGEDFVKVVYEELKLQISESEKK
jgi:hypothetical protein